jgi:hypothetical protein
VYYLLNLKDIEYLTFKIDIDTYDNLKDLCLHCEVYDFKTNEFICTIRALNFIDLENKIRDKYCMEVR